MDSNVSKKGFLHKFFKLGFKNEKASLSVKELLRQRLLSTIEFWQQSYNFGLDTHFLATNVGSKIILLDSSIETILSNSHAERVLSQSPDHAIIYSSSITFLLASLTKLNSKIIAENIIDLLVLPENNSNSQYNLNLFLNINKSGMINFHLDRTSIAIWLERSGELLQTKNANINHDNLLPLRSLEDGDRNGDLFPAQYIHARCCNLLLLGEREKLFIFDKPTSIYSVSWLNEDKNLWLDHEAELILLRQLFLVTDLFVIEYHNWHKLVLNFSMAIAIFLAECRFLGEIQQRTPQKAIARLKLIALSQYWLQRILVEKLHTVAPTSL